MDFRIIFDHMPQYVLIRTQGTTTAADHDLLMKELTSAREWKTGTDQIVDHRKLEVGSLSLDLMSEIQKVVSRYEDKLGKGKVAFVVSTDAMHGFARMYELVGGEEVHGDISIFKTMEGAIEWLNEERT
ncbi:MAG: hypothetical protein K9M82_00765 [Deltaproteobacteria bacterium]|nr:hypothetical protein [Deltaproteobacteria bacterium]